MRLTKKKAKIVKSTINAWIEENVISQDHAQMLLESYEVVGFDWKRLAKYSFWASIACIVISVGAIVADDYLKELLSKIYNAPTLIKLLGTTIAATLIYYYAVKRKSKKPEKVFSNEAILFLGALATAPSIAFFAEVIAELIDKEISHFSIISLLATIVYGILGLWFPSKLVWILSLLSLGSWMGTETGYASDWGAYYLGMNYPLRFVLFGIILTASSFAFMKCQIRKDFLRPTRAMGLLYLFIALWIMSIFGNYGDLHEWQEVKHIELFHWSLLFGLVAIASIYHGIKEDDGMTRGFGITFLFINLYTKYFEYFWNNTHKAIFFAILAASFWYLGSRAEKIWNLGGLSKKEKYKGMKSSI
ncbi:MAG: DUF2157 domain-containing protein [Candidatus Scalindua sp.]|nr:DUF2157 domain-containing protein [Candidatus Scalindua sp.]